ncbi:MAG: vWA domain-containing protein [Rhizobiaceae bacterium]
MNTAVRKANPDGKLAENILFFARTLRGAGMKLGPASVVDCVRAVQVGGISDRDDFYWTLHSVLVNRREDWEVFDQTFRLFWRSRELVEKMLQMFSPQVTGDEKRQKPEAAESRVSQALFPDHGQRQESERPEIEVDASRTASSREVLRDKDFAQMSAEELKRAKEAMAKMRLPISQVRTRRYMPVNRMARIDPRRMLRQSMRTAGDIVLPQFREVRLIEPPVVILADISGSMSQYSRTFLHFFHAISENRRHVHTFLFGTKLTNITRQLRNKDPDVAFQDCADAVEDWSGGTRIGATLHDFNRWWSRRVLGQGALVLLITDGLERDEHDILDHEMDRLHRSCRRLIWLNPLLRFEGFEAAARGIRTMLPHVDEFRPIHSLNALSGLCDSLSSRFGAEHVPQNWLSELKIA